MLLPQLQVLDDIDAIAPRRETATREMERRIVSQLSNSLDGMFTVYVHFVLILHNQDLELFGPTREKPLSEQLQFSEDGEVTLEKEKVHSELVNIFSLDLLVNFVH